MGDQHADTLDRHSNRIVDMFSTLLESKATKQRSTGSTIFSVFLHVSLGVMAVYATARGTGVIQEEKQEEIEFVQVEDKPEPEPEPEKPKEPPPDMPATPPPPKGFQVLTAPVDIPDVIPDIDLTKSITNEDDFSGRGVAGGVAKGVEGGTGPVITDAPLFEFQVEKPALSLNAPGSQPIYPTVLKNANIAGQVTAMFVVDTTGRADGGTFKVLESDHDMFTNAVKAALPKMRFMPAEVGGRKVKMWVQQAFQFQLAK